ncbi:MAG: M14 family metallopeptidase [Bacteroidetes bacterium]|nr:M14 family metallopeptidase [Bacteroidota bacterium]
MKAQTPDFQTPFERNGQTTATYAEAIGFYQKLDAAYPQLQVTEWGSTDAGFPLHVAVVSQSKNFDAAALRSEGKLILLINNAIHPGEPEGVDASMMLCRDLLQKPEFQPFLKNVVVAFIPFYNIGGGLNRGCCSRANQNGPEEYGFRGNAKNLDLNRDFIKCDTKNARTFVQVFQHWRPDVLVDNHTSNGANYPYTMTMLTTQPDKLGTLLGSYLRRILLPRLYNRMASRGQEMCPYVNEFKDTPADGIYGFNDTPRFSSGYAALHHCIGFVPETHMLKPFPQRVLATYDFMDVLLRELSTEHSRLRDVRQQAIAQSMTDTYVNLDWKPDEARPDTIVFKGYEGKYKPSEVTGLDRLWYDRTAPYEKKIPYWSRFEPTAQVMKPAAYIIPQAYTEVIERLQMNGVQLRRLSADAEPEVELYRIGKYETRNAYEGHYLHHKVEVTTEVKRWRFHRGDYVAFTDQPAVRFLAETLEPQAIDSYFAWNFFDGILGQKEYFSPYVFEDIAAEFLKENPEAKAELEAKRQADPEFAKSQWAQLFFVYQKTPYFEPTVNLYPVGRVMKGAEGLGFD